MVRRAIDHARGRVLDTTIRLRRPLIVAAHLSLFAASYVLAFALRFDFAVPPVEAKLLLATLPLIVAVRAGAFWVLRLYEGLWRYVSVRDGVEILKGVTASSAVFTVGVLVSPLAGFPRSIVLLDAILCVGLTAGLRIVSRIMLEWKSKDEAHTKEALVIGAGDVAEAL